MMSARDSAIRMTKSGIVFAVLSIAPWCGAQTPTLDAPPTSSQGIVMDQVVAVVNGDLVLESDVDEDRRFQIFQPFRDLSQAYSRDKSIERLVDRALILQQQKLQPQPPITDAEVNAQLTTLRKDIPACKEFQCETDAGWQKFVAAQGFTVQELTERWRERMEVLRFIEQRFKMGIRISQAEIKDYYDKTLLPEYTKRKATPPKMDVIADRIQEILLQQQVGALLEDWLQSLKAQGSVRMTRAEEARP
jgi:peptidyl-prolyl cis-trans isomerase SurA